MITVIDTDPGIDDALALLLAWNSPEIDLLALTTVAGNVPVAIGTVNVLRLLDLRRPAHRPLVAAGADRPLVRELHTATRYHGKDGLGDVGGWPSFEPQAAATNGVEVLVDAARRHGPQLTIVALGPLTNLALAVRADRRALATIGRLVAMGGAVDVPGNVTPTAEFNMNVDPDAAAEVFAAGLPLDLVPLDATQQAVLPREALDAALKGAPGPLASRIAGFSDHAFRVDAVRGARGMALHDPLAVAVAFDPTLVGWEPVRLTIGPDGETRRSTGAPNCRIARKVESERFLATFLARLCPAPASPGHQ